VASGEPRGKAGAYAIQGRIAAWIEHIEGSYSGVMGLPLHETAQLLARRVSGRVSRGGATRLRRMASQDILINWTPQETRVAIVENGAVQELHVERTLERGLVGNVYLGKVARVLPGMQSAFIDIGLERAAFLHVADLHPAGSGLPTAAAAATRHADREAGLRRPDADGAGHQGRRSAPRARGCPRQVSIAGRMLVLPAAGRPHRHQPEDRLARAARAAAQRMQLLVGTRESGGGGGFILRTNAEEARRRRAGRRHRLPAQDLGRSASARRAARPAACCTRT
jgi:hypothetical protein